MAGDVPVWPDNMALMTVKGGCLHPGLEIIFRVGKILPMVLRHMRGYHDRIPLAAGLSWMDSHPVPVEEYFHCIARYTDADRFPNQVIWDRILV